MIGSSAPKILIQPNQIQLIDEMDSFPENQKPLHHYDLLCSLHILISVAISRAGGIPNIVTRRAKK
jgi:hypothetical protein